MLVIQMMEKTKDTDKRNCRYESGEMEQIDGQKSDNHIIDITKRKSPDVRFQFGIKISYKTI